MTSKRFLLTVTAIVGVAAVAVLHLSQRLDTVVPQTDPGKTRMAESSEPGVSSPKSAKEPVKDPTSTDATAKTGPVSEMETIPKGTTEEANDLKNATKIGEEGAASRRGDAPMKLSDEVLRQIAILEAEKASRTPAQIKMDSQLVLGARFARGERLEGVPNLRLGLEFVEGGRVAVDINATVSEELLKAIEAGGGKVVNTVPRLNAVRAHVTPLLAESLAQREDVRSIHRASVATTNAGPITSEGDVAHGADVFRLLSRLNLPGNADGTGVKIGVLSNSVHYLDDSITSGELPENVTILAGQSGVGTATSGHGEGTAMLEIVHDLAPGAELFFATGFGDETQFAQNILDLRAEGCDIIIDDIGFNRDSPFQEGAVSLAVRTVCESGALYFSSAGNRGNKNGGTSTTWEGDYNESNQVSGPGQASFQKAHSFGSQIYNTVTGAGPVHLYWSDPLGQSVNDFDLYVLNSDGTAVTRFSSDFQNGTQDPFESTVYSAFSGERVVIGGSRAGESLPVRFFHLEAAGGLEISTEGSTRGHNASGAANAFCVAQTYADGLTAPFSGGAANPVAHDSSDGPRRVFYHPDGTPITPGNLTSTGGMVLQKPDITAAGKVHTSVPGFEAFEGTSAAAPHAGAIAALLLSYDPAMTPAQVRAALQNAALDIEAPGVDRDSGHGIVMPGNLLNTINQYVTGWVDFAEPVSGNGSYESPWNTMAIGVSEISAGRTLFLKGPRSSPETLTISKPMIIQAVGGNASVGD